jgi:hypothetical protein
LNYLVNDSSLSSVCIHTAGTFIVHCLLASRFGVENVHSHIFLVFDSSMTSIYSKASGDSGGQPWDFFTLCSYRTFGIPQKEVVVMVFVFTLVIYFLVSLE